METEQSRRISFRCDPPCNAVLGKYSDTGNQPYYFEIKCHRRGCKAIMRRGNILITNRDDLVSFRCNHIDRKKSVKFGQETICNKLLAFILPGTDIEIRCPRCGNISRTPSDTESTGE